MNRKVAADIIAYLLITLFVYAATSKLLDYQKFTIQIGQSPMLTHMAGFIAWSIPAIEFAIAIALIISTTRIVGLFASFSLMTVFTAYIIVITRYSHYIPCSCGGILQKMGWTQHLVFNIVFVLLSLVAIWIETSAVWSTETKKSAL